MNRKIIGITGLAGAGKDTIGDILVTNLSNWQKMSFAEHLKDVASLLFGFDRKMLAGETPEDRTIREQPDKFWSEKMGKDFTPRFALQFLGTNLLRNQLHQNIWVDCLERKIVNSDKNIVITDVRFPNEIEMIRNLGGVIWRVERGERPSWWDLASEANLNNIQVYNGKYAELASIHSSEQVWIDVDNPVHIFKNNGTIDDLKQKVLEYMAQ